MLAGCRASVTPPQGAIVLEPVDVSQFPIDSPVKGKLLIKACDSIARNAREEDISIPCILGLLDPENDQLTRLVSFADVQYRLCSWSMEWSPSGMQFLCEQGFIHPGSFSVSAFGVDGKKAFEHVGRDAHWSLDGRYLTAATCFASNLNPGSVTTVFDTASWREVCQDVEGGAIMDCHTWVGPCSPDVILDTVTYTKTPEPPDQNRYQVTIESDWLNIVDTKTNVKKIYFIPGYRIEVTAWSPK